MFFEGAKGCAGDPGIIGVPGERGQDGDQGLPGEQGDIGDPGTYVRMSVCALLYTVECLVPISKCPGSLDCKMICWVSTFLGVPLYISYI